MDPGILQQARQFVICVVGGISFGIFWDVLRGLRRDSLALRGITDFLVGIGLLIDNWILFLYVGKEDYRIFFLVGLFCGFLLWRVTVSEYFTKGCRLFWRGIFFPWAAIWGILKKIIKKSKKIFKNPFSNERKSVKIKGQQSTNGGENGG